MSTHTTTHQEPLDVLFVSERALWPLDQGSCVHGYHMAMALADLGIRVGIASHTPPPDAHAHSVPLGLRDRSIEWPKTTEQDVRRFLRGWRGPGSAARRRLARYQGRNLRLFAGIIPLVERYRPATVMALGQHGPLMLRALGDYPATKRIWYAADEPVFFELSCMRREPISAIPHRLSKVALYTALESLFVRGLDGAIGVNPTDTRLLRWFGGVRSAVTIRNGVDTDFFSPAPHNLSLSTHAGPKPRSLVFWGRMDFEPNIDAVTWFARHVWPQLHHCWPNATWQIVGKNPHRNVQRLTHVPGIKVLGEVPDIRPYAQQAAVTILPMRCGGGIKNKLLEAAAMGRPVAASPRTLQGLNLNLNRMPALVCNSPDQWVEGVRRLWSDIPLATKLGQNARQWVQTQHTWPQAARALLAWLGVTPPSYPLPTSGYQPVELNMSHGFTTRQANAA